MEQGGSDPPTVGDGDKGKVTGFRTAIGNVQEDHCGVDKGVLGIELGVEGAGVVPESGVVDGDGADGFDVPGELIKLFDGDSLAVGEGFNLLHVTAEVADFIECVPGSHLKRQFALHVRDFHGDTEQVLFRMGERDLVADGGVGMSGEKQVDSKANRGKE